MELHVRGVSGTYSKGVQALKDVTFTTPVEVHGLLGPDGGGPRSLPSSGRPP